MTEHSTAVTKANLKFAMRF